MARIIYANYEWFDPQDETPFLLTEAIHHVNASGRSLRSCALRGRTNTLTGEVIKLRVCRLPQGVGTTVQEYQRWLSAVVDGGEESR